VREASVVCDVEDSLADLKEKSVSLKLSQSGHEETQESHRNETESLTRRGRLRSDFMRSEESVGEDLALTDSRVEGVVSDLRDQ
jgi:hypothetical protein